MEATAATPAKPEVFSRKSSGLVRVMSPWSAFMYNFLTMGVIFPWTYMWAPQAFPGCSVWMACLFATLLALPIALTYVWMATAMPRSGGDYVFQSRVFGGGVGFPVVASGFLTWFLQWTALATWLMCCAGIAPVLMGLGVYYESRGLIDAAVWVQSPFGIVTLGAVALIVFGLLLISGLKNYVYVQYVMFWSTIIMLIIVVVQFLRTTPEEFAAAINHYAGFVDDNPDYFAWIQKDVADAGFDINPAFALGATLLAAPIAWTSTQWAAFSVQQGGEIKGARVFKNQMLMIVGSLLAVGACLAIVGWTYERAVGTAFFNAVSASYYGGYTASGSGVGSILPFPGVFAIVISPHPIITVLVGLAFFLGATQVVCNAYIGSSRLIVGMSLDRALPAFLARVSPKYRTPAVAIVVYGVLSFFVSIGYNYSSVWYTLTLGVTFAAGYVFVVSVLSGALLPFRARDLYLASPGAKYTVFGVPLVTVVGLVGFCLAVAAEIAFLADPGYGLRGTTPYIVVAGVFVFWLVFYWVTRSYNKSRGIEMSYAFREIPPE